MTRFRLIRFRLIIYVNKYFMSGILSMIFLRVLLDEKFTNITYGFKIINVNTSLFYIYFKRMDGLQLEGLLFLSLGSFRLLVQRAGQLNKFEIQKISSFKYFTDVYSYSNPSKRKSVNKYLYSYFTWEVFIKLKLCKSDCDNFHRKMQQLINFILLYLLYKNAIEYNILRMHSIMFICFEKIQSLWNINNQNGKVPKKKDIA